MLKLPKSLASSSISITTNQSETDLITAFSRFIRVDVAAGTASQDTIRTYLKRAEAFLNWCSRTSIDPGRAAIVDIKKYRHWLVGQGFAPATIAIALAVVRRLYAAAVSSGLRQDNPAVGVRAPRRRNANEDFRFLSEVDLTLLLRSIPATNKLKHLRDRALLGLMSLQGLRTVEIHRACVDDLRQHGNTSTLIAKGKGKDRVLYLRADVATAINRYLDGRAKVIDDDQGTPLFTAAGNRAGGRRLSRRGIRNIVDFYLNKIELKKPGLSGHALRHTAATLAYKATRDVRAVQEMLGHSSPETTSRYAHIDRVKNNAANRIPVELT